MPGVTEALDQLDLPICVASSSSPAKLRLGLETVGLYDRFSPNIVSATLVSQGKPEPDIFLFAAGWMKVSPMRCLVVVDSVPGVQAAIRAGIPGLGFTGGSHNGPNHSNLLTEAGAVSTFSHMSHLPGLIHKRRTTLASSSTATA